MTQHSRQLRLQAGPVMEPWRGSHLRREHLLQLLKNQTSRWPEALPQRQSSVPAAGAGQKLPVVLPLRQERWSRRLPRLAAGLYDQDFFVERPLLQMCSHRRRTDLAAPRASVQQQHPAEHRDPRH